MKQESAGWKNKGMDNASRRNWLVARQTSTARRAGWFGAKAVEIREAEGRAETNL